MEENDNKTEEDKVSILEFIIPLTVLGGYFLLGDSFLIVSITVALIIFFGLEVSRDEETIERRRKKWGKKGLLAVMFKMMTFQKPLDEKDKIGYRIFIGVFLIFKVALIFYIYLNYFLS